MRFESRTEPLGSLTGKQPTFEAASHRKRNNAYEPTEEPIPKFGNFEDTDLKEMVVDVAQVISIRDDYFQTLEEEY